MEMWPECIVLKCGSETEGVKEVRKGQGSVPRFYRNALREGKQVVGHLPWQTALNSLQWSSSSIHGVLQARILERVAISFSRGSS